MPAETTCPKCSRPLRVPDKLMGQAVKCPSCLEQFTATAEMCGQPPTPIGKEAFRPPAESPLSRDDLERRAADDDRYRSGDVPPRAAPPSLPPRLDDDEDDDFTDDRAYRRGRRRELALERVSGPANGLIAVGIIGIIMTVIGFLANVIQVANPGPGQAPEDAAVAFVSTPIALVTSILVLIGAQKMRRLESYGMAKAAAIIAMIPCISPCCILGLPFGIQAFNALNDPDVKDAFR
jgi:hypothetical protein